MFLEAALNLRFKLLCVAVIAVTGCFGLAPKKSQQGDSFRGRLLEPEKILHDGNDPKLNIRHARLLDIYQGLIVKGAPESILRTVQANLRRWESLTVFEDQYIEVNIPSYTVTIFENSEEILSDRAIVGKPTAQTPILRSQIRYLELNPYWEVPAQIAAKEIIPELKKDPSYIAKNHMELFSASGHKLAPEDLDCGALELAKDKIHVHQLPGPWNAVGKIKFAFPNAYSIFLHGTPNQHLFNREQRCFSHGCIRIADPLSLAGYLLRDTEWTKERLSAAIESGKTKRIVLKESVPIYLNYWTAWAESTGELRTAPDIYGLDG